MAARILLAFAFLTCAESATILRGASQQAVGYGNTITKESNVQVPSVVAGQAANMQASVEGLMEAAKEKARKIIQEPQQQQQASGNSAFERAFWQIIFGIIYYYVIVKHYPKMTEKHQPNDKSRELQEKNEVEATCHTSCPNLFLSWCCTGPRAAHTLYTTGVQENYGLGLVLMSCVPCCTLAYYNSYSELNEKLGGEKRGILQSLLCAFCCTCCVVAQDAQSLDYIMDVQTELCSVEGPGMDSM